MRFTSVLAGLLLGVAACAAPVADSGEPTGATRQEIVGGSVSDEAQDATVLINETGRDACTGSLIAPNLVLTARHCVTDFNYNDDCGLPFGRDFDASLYTISVGAYATPQQTVARATRLYVPATTRNGLCGGDVALLLLDKDVPNAKIARVRFTPPLRDELTTAVGYGEERTGRTQRRDVQILAIGPTTTSYTTYQGQTFPMEVSPDEFTTSESTCYGDSGAPLLDSINQIIGVASRGPDDLCVDRPTYWTSLGAHEALIKNAAIAAGHPLLPPLPVAAKFGPSTTEDRPGKTPSDDSAATDEETAKKKSKHQGPLDAAAVGCTIGVVAPASRAWEALGLALVAFCIARRRTGTRQGRQGRQRA